MHRFTKTVSVICLLFAASVMAGTSETTFTYQGELKENGGPANGSYDMSFSLWDEDAGGNQVGVTVDQQDVQVSQGRFTVQLDMGANAFNNGQRWLQITVGGFTLVPRQPITRSPYSIQTRGIFVDENHNVGIGTSNPQRPLDIESEEAIMRLSTTDGSPNTVSKLQFKSVNAPGIFTPLGVIEFVSQDDESFAVIQGTKAGDSSAQIAINLGPEYLFPEMRILSTGVEFGQDARIGIDQGMDTYFQANGGQVGIGTTDPLSDFHVHEPGSSTGDVMIGSPAGSPGMTGVANNGHRRDIRFSDSGLGLFTSPSGSMPSSLNGLFVHESGSVGIGTTNPTARLSVIGSDSNPVLRAEMNGTGPGLRLADNAEFLDISDNSINTEGNGLFGDPLFLNNDTTNAVIVGNGGGNCGIGGASAGFPLVKLHVDGGSDASPANPTGGYVLVGDANDLNIVMDNNEIMARNNGTTSSLFLNNNGGDIVCGGPLHVDYQIVESQSDSAACPSGTKVIGGGCRIDGDAEVRQSYPSNDRWICEQGDQSGFITLTSYAICAEIR